MNATNSPSCPAPLWMVAHGTSSDTRGDLLRRPMISPHRRRSYRRVEQRSAREAHNLEVAGSNPATATYKRVCNPVRRGVGDRRRSRSDVWQRRSRGKVDASLVELDAQPDA